MMHSTFEPTVLLVEWSRLLIVGCSCISLERMGVSRSHVRGLMSSVCGVCVFMMQGTSCTY